MSSPILALLAILYLILLACLYFQWQHGWFSTRNCLSCDGGCCTMSVNPVHINNGQYLPTFQSCNLTLPWLLWQRYFAWSIRKPRVQWRKSYPTRLNQAVAGAEGYGIFPSAECPLTTTRLSTSSSCQEGIWHDWLVRTTGVDQGRRSSEVCDLEQVSMKKTSMACGTDFNQLLSQI